MVIMFMEFFPNFTSFNSLRECFENENNSYDWIEQNIPPVTLSTGLATKIIQLLESKKQGALFLLFSYIRSTFTS